MSWLENLILEAWEEGWSREEVEVLLAVLEDLRESSEDRKWRRRPWLRWAESFAIGLLGGGLLFLILRLWGWR
ncbi:MAG TPA: hypothetical protein VG457_01795 [Planctomycetota bacterium]|jgi:hypothetical protein|nr:hypothetical protein [Planctomycetota bacterium]